MTAWILWVIVFSTGVGNQWKPVANPDWIPVNGYDAFQSCKEDEKYHNSLNDKRQVENKLDDPQKVYTCFPLGFDPRENVKK